MPTYASSNVTAKSATSPPWGTMRDTEDDAAMRTGRISNFHSVAPWDEDSAPLSSGRKHTNFKSAAVDHDTCPWGFAHPEGYGKGKKIVKSLSRGGRSIAPFAVENEADADPVDSFESKEGKGAGDGLDGESAPPMTEQDLEAFKAQIASEMLEMGRSDQDILDALAYADEKFNKQRAAAEAAEARATEYSKNCEAAAMTRCKSRGEGVASIFAGP